MNTKKWIELKAGCPAREEETWHQGEKSGKQYVCSARSKDEYIKMCKYQKDCPFLYWERVREYWV